MYDEQTGRDMRRRTNPMCTGALFVECIKTERKDGIKI